jgi:hypothetical protein
MVPMTGLKKTPMKPLVTGRLYEDQKRIFIPAAGEPSRAYTIKMLN